MTLSALLLYPQEPGFKEHRSGDESLSVQGWGVEFKTVKLKETTEHGGKEGG